MSTATPLDGPWMFASACGAAAVNSSTGKLTAVACPSRLCPPAGLVPLDEYGRISPHEGLVPGICPFIGYRVVPDPGVNLRDPTRRRS
ncbi:hypothetical protein [Nocardia sp. BMG51109]|uniref:hypothetical protein n=1 Tax=Nocardia sp. BMG51109 TaxID=1056816 RepID=UPI0012EC8564|nr:hypothetical protein [Nocardia sp. BMG51109]